MTRRTRAQRFFARMFWTAIFGGLVVFLILQPRFGFSILGLSIAVVLVMAVLWVAFDWVMTALVGSDE
jgi:hypothetical protein